MRFPEITRSTLSKRPRNLLAQRLEQVLLVQVCSLYHLVGVQH